MELRNFNLGRQQQTLLNEEHYNIFKILEPYFKNGNPNAPSSGPISIPGTVDEVKDGAMWIDRSPDPTNSDLKYYSGGQWNLFFKDRFKITQDIISAEEPSEPIEGQLWIDHNGTLHYYYKGVWKPIKAVPDNLHEDANLQGFEDFMIIQSLTASEKTLIDNFSSWLLSELPVPTWEEGKTYEKDKGCIKDLDVYICKRDHESDVSSAPPNVYYWTKVRKLFQYLVPNSYEDKFYINGYFVHENCKLKEAELVPTAIAGEFKAGEKTAEHLAFKNPPPRPGGKEGDIEVVDVDNKTKKGKKKSKTKIEEKEISTLSIEDYKDVPPTHIHDDACKGYRVETDVSITFPIDMVEGKVANAVHVNPKRLHNVTKKFIMIDKKNPVIEVPEHNTEFYGFYGGIGKLLLKTDDPNTSEYKSIVSNNIDCILLSRKTAETYDFIYAIHYEFLETKIKALGSVAKKRQRLNDENYIWIGPANPDRICVFGQGLFYAQDKDNISPTWYYNSENEYLYINESLQDYNNMVKNFDFSVIQFPEKFEGKITNNFEVVNGREMFRINLPIGYPRSTNFVVFSHGLALDVVAEEVVKHPTNPRILYIPSITKEVYQNSGQAFYCVCGTQGTFDGKSVDMYRGTTRAKYGRQIGVHIPTYTDPKYPIDGGLLLRDNEAPILFVDGVLVFQKEIERGNGYITIYGLTEGQEVLMLADYKDPSLGEDEPSDNLLFEDTVSYATIPTPQSDATIVYVANSILSDASSVYTSRKPIDEGYHGEIRYHANYDADDWYRFDASKGEWIKIDNTVMYEDHITHKQIPLIEVLDKNARGYTHSKKSISFLQNIKNDVCTYYAYKYSDSIERPLLMGYAFPNGKDGVNIKSTEDISNPQPFKTNGRHVYVPGRNELTLYLNGVRQNINSPYDLAFNNSKNREGDLGKFDEFVLAIDDETKVGKAIPETEGYHVYSLKKWNAEKTIIPKEPLSDSQIKQYEQEGWKVEYISSPNRNVVFYVIEPCETGESKACERKVLTFKNALAHDGAYMNNTYLTDEFILTRGNLRVFINGLRQPYGNYTTLESLESDDPYKLAYKVLDQRTIEIQDPIIGGLGGNDGDDNNPLFELGEIRQPDGSYKTAYYEVIDEIVIESRRDNKLREITIPIKDNSGEFSERDGLPPELFKTKDRVMIYINGMAYGKDYKLEEGTIKLLNSEIRQFLGNSKRDIITFEWR